MSCAYGFYHIVESTPRRSVERFRGWWSEGTPEQEYEDSVFNLYTTETLTPSNTYTAIIDRASGIKSNCGHPVSFRPSASLGNL